MPASGVPSTSSSIWSPALADASRVTLNVGVASLVTLSALVLVGTFGGCRGDRDAFGNYYQEQQIEQKIAQGKRYLAEQRYYDAVELFDRVLQEDDASNTDARFGRSLGRLLQFASLVRIISELTGDDSPLSDENDFLHSLIEDLVTDLISRFDDIAFLGNGQRWNP